MVNQRLIAYLLITGLWVVVESGLHAFSQDNSPICIGANNYADIPDAATCLQAAPTIAGKYPPPTPTITSVSPTTSNLPSACAYDSTTSTLLFNAANVATNVGCADYAYVCACMDIVTTNPTTVAPSQTPTISPSTTSPTTVSPTSSPTTLSPSKSPTSLSPSTCSPTTSSPIVVSVPSVAPTTPPTTPPASSPTSVGSSEGGGGGGGGSADNTAAIAGGVVGGVAGVGAIAAGVYVYVTFYSGNALTAGGGGISTVHPQPINSNPTVGSVE
mmetsp:Transcript_41091/g.66086  ORF Transcript_41091/g.66086 Transcript_41091/m.66086 type:complete len:272 (+) Transcript_41091:91-906(+)